MFCSFLLNSFKTSTNFTMSFQLKSFLVTIDKDWMFLFVREKRISIGLCVICWFCNYWMNTVNISSNQTNIFIQLTWNEWNYSNWISNYLQNKGMPLPVLSNKMYLAIRITHTI